MPIGVENGVVIAESEDTVIVEGNHYFPIESVADGVLQPSQHTTVCSWKGTANYYDVVVGDDRNANAHTERGTYMLRRSLERFGFLEPGVLDANNRIIGGNNRTEAAAAVAAAAAGADEGGD